MHIGEGYRCPHTPANSAIAKLPAQPAVVKNVPASASLRAQFFGASVRERAKHTAVITRHSAKQGSIGSAKPHMKSATGPPDDCRARSLTRATCNGRAGLHTSIGDSSVPLAVGRRQIQINEPTDASMHGCFTVTCCHQPTHETRSHKSIEVALVSSSSTGEPVKLSNKRPADSKLLAGHDHTTCPFTPIMPMPSPQWK